jgi:hypothetical protein
MAHTPGPWAVEWSEEEGNDGVTVESPDGPVAFRVLEVDARLIAAAPDLLAAAKLVLEAGDQEYVKFIVRDAISKAEGRE